MNYDLEERVTKFSEQIIKFARNLDRDLINDPMIDQVIRSATSIGANYMEASEAISSKDFLYKIGICKKEAKETKFWIKSIIEANPEHEKNGQILAQEAHELLLIMVTSYNTKKKQIDEENK